MYSCCDILLYELNTCGWCLCFYVLFMLVMIPPAKHTYFKEWKYHSYISSRAIYCHLCCRNLATHLCCWAPLSSEPLCRVSQQKRLQSTRSSSSRSNCSSRNNRHWQLQSRYWLWLLFPVGTTSRTHILLFCCCSWWNSWWHTVLLKFKALYQN